MQDNVMTQFTEGPPRVEVKINANNLAQLRDILSAVRDATNVKKAIREDAEAFLGDLPTPSTPIGSHDVILVSVETLRRARNIVSMAAMASNIEGELSTTAQRLLPLLNILVGRNQ